MSSQEKLKRYRFDLRHGQLSMDDPATAERVIALTEPRVGTETTAGIYDRQIDALTRAVDTGKVMRKGKEVQLSPGERRRRGVELRRLHAARPDAQALYDLAQARRANPRG